MALTSSKFIRFLLLFYDLPHRVKGFAVIAPRPNPAAPDGLVRHTTASCFLVTEADVIEAVEMAEDLWAKALEARKTANALSDRAEEEAEAVSMRASEVETIMKDRSQPISMEKLNEADAVAKSSIDAGAMVNNALELNGEADRLQELADIALKKSEELLDQHLIDFPDSPLSE